jgi:hypothetical protein
MDKLIGNLMDKLVGNLILGFLSLVALRSSICLQVELLFCCWSAASFALFLASCIFCIVVWSLSCCFVVAFALFCFVASASVLLLWHVCSFCKKVALFN